MRTRSRVLCLVAAVLAVGALAPACASAQPVLWGAMVDGDAYGAGHTDPPWDMGAQDIFEAHAGKRASIIHYGQAWYQGSAAQPFYPGPAAAVAARGAVPFLDWNPWDLYAGGGPNQPKFRLAQINAGKFDAYIKSWAKGAALWGGRILVRPMHEMNGNWYPWSERANGNRSGEYVKAWRRIVSLARAQGATNIEWVWCPNAVYSGSQPLSGLFPGQSYVDWTAIDAYNFGAPWTALHTAVNPTYQQIAALAPSRPFMIAETGSAETGGSKAAWFDDGLNDVANGDFPLLRAFVYFNVDLERPWRIESSPASQAAFAAGIARPEFVAGGQ